MNCVTTAHVSVPWWPRSNAHPCTGYKHLPYQRIARVLRTLTRTESTRYEFVAQPELSFPGNLYIRDGFFIYTPNWELAFGGGVQRREGARNLTSLRARRRAPAEPGRVRRRKFSTLAPFCGGV